MNENYQIQDANTGAVRTCECPGQLCALAPSKCITDTHSQLCALAPSKGNTDAPIQQDGPAKLVLTNQFQV